MINKVHFSSENESWATPQEFFDSYDDKYSFTLDVCAEPHNAKCAEYFTKDDDALVQDWSKYSTSCWMNPPYGRQIKYWLKKAYDESLKGVTVVCLIPARTDTIYWHDYVMKGDIEFIKGRLKFNGHKNPAPFPSAVVVFRGKEIHD